MNHPQDTPILDQHYLKQDNLKTVKRWVIAISLPGFTIQKRDNTLLEAAYHRLIDTVKTQYLKPGERYIDRDYKSDMSEGIFAMHCFLTPHFYISLECNLSYDYKVEYCFYNCRYEQAVRKPLDHFTMNNRSIEVDLYERFETFYKQTLEEQSPSFIQSVKANDVR